MPTETFDTVGSHEWTVPGGVDEVDIECRGAQGGESDTGSGDGGLGGEAAGTLPVSPGDTLYVYVGGQPTDETGGFNGGGGGGYTDEEPSRYGGAGGGASDVRHGGETFSDRVIVAGGGGGESRTNNAAGGDGGGQSGGDGGGGGGGNGGTQSSGGSGGGAGEDGTLGEGGAGAEYSGGTYEGGGGGGGYYGGGGGSASSSADYGGGGGSGYIGGVSAASMSTGVNTGDGDVVITYEASPPSNLSAAAVAGDQIDLNWDGIAGTDGYYIYRDTSADVPVDSSHRIDSVSGDTTTTYSDTGLSTGTTYYYVVTAYTAETESGASNEDSAETYERPSAPSGVSASAVDEAQIDLDWTDEGGDPNPDEWTIYRAESSGSSLSDYSAIATVTSTSFSDTGLINGRQYHYRVTATNDVGESDSSGEATGTTELPAPTLGPVTGGDRQCDVEWSVDDNNPDGEIVVIRDGGAVHTISDLSTTSYTDTGTDLDGKEYVYAVERDTGDATATSDTVAATTILPPVEGLTVESVDGRYATLSWTDPSNNADGYRLLLREDDSGDYVQDGDDVAPVAEGETKTHQSTELLDGMLYGATVETFTTDTTAREDQ